MKVTRVHFFGGKGTLTACGIRAWLSLRSDNEAETAAGHRIETSRRGEMVTCRKCRKELDRPLDRPLLSK